MFNEIENAIIEILRQYLSEDEEAAWYVPADRVRRQLPSADSLPDLDKSRGELRSNFRNIIFSLRPNWHNSSMVPTEQLPSVFLIDVDFSVEAVGIGDVGGLRKVQRTPEEGDSLIQLSGLKFDLHYQLDVWAGDPDRLNEITLTIIALLLSSKDTLAKTVEMPSERPNLLIEYSILGANPSQGKSERVAEGIYRKQIDYTIEAELRIGILRPAIAEIRYEKV